MVLLNQRNMNLLASATLLSIEYILQSKAKSTKQHCVSTTTALKPQNEFLNDLNSASQSL